MRELDRIDDVLEEIRAYWMRNPDLRLGQIVCNAAVPGCDPFYMEGDRLVEWLQSQRGARD